MKRLRVIFLAWSVMSVAAAEAGTITLNFGAPQTITVPDAAMERIRQNMNAQRLGAGPFPYPTIEAALREVLAPLIRSSLEEAANLDRADACVRYRTLTAAQQASITAQLGGKSPCP